MLGALADSGPERLRIYFVLCIVTSALSCFKKLLARTTKDTSLAHHRPIAKWLSAECCGQTMILDSPVESVLEVKGAAEGPPSKFPTFMPDIWASCAPRTTAKRIAIEQLLYTQVIKWNARGILRIFHLDQRSDLRS